MDWETKLTEEIRQVIDKHPSIYLTKNNDGTYHDEIYADYRDEMSEKDAIAILEDDHPMEAFWEKMSEWYMDAEIDYKDEVINLIREELVNDDGAFPEGLTDEQDAFLQEWCCEHIYYDYPDEHFLGQEFCVNITLDTGDGNYDYALNSHYPCYAGGRYGEAMDDKASLVWLAKQQGYTKGQLRMALDEGDMSEPKGFLQSCRVEMANLPSHMSTVTFLTKMTLDDLIRVNEVLKLRGDNYDARKNPQCGYIVLDKSVECGLFDPWSGGGSVLEIQLEKDVKIPLKYVRAIMPDGWERYDVGEVYGLCGSAWGDCVKEIHIPKKFQAGVA